MKLQKLYVTIIAIGLGLSACASPDALLGTTEFSFGDVINGEIVSYDVVLTNDGNAPLEIEYVSTSCGCTIAESDKDVIMPGEHATIHIEFDSGAHGPDSNGELKRQVFIQTNQPDIDELEISFDVNVLPAD